MLEAIKNRISRRSFEKEKLEKKEIEKIKSDIEELNKQSQLTIQFVEDGSEAFSNIAKSYGMFSNIRSIILMKGKSSDVNLKEKIGYDGEEIILRATKRGLGTCWVGGTFEKDKLRIEKEEELVCVIVVGKVQKVTIKEKIIRNAVSKKRKPIEDRLITDTKQLPEWLIEGVEVVRLAPSAKNTQKVKFEYKEGNVYAKVSNDDEFDLVDLGIAKKHFEIVAKGSFELGNGSVFLRKEERK